MTAAFGWRRHVDLVRAGRVLRLVNFHHTAASTRQALREELGAWQRHHTGLGLADLDAFFDTGRWPAAVPDSEGDSAAGPDPRPAFVPVFYEGYADHAAVAAPVCEELGLTGWFAVVTGFVDCPVGEQEAFARSHWIALPAEERSQRLAMTWDEVARVAERHVVFPHTASHDGIAETVTEADLEREVLAPRRRMAAQAGVEGAIFAWLGGSPYGASERHDRAIREAGYRYVVSNTMIQRVRRP